MDLKKLHPATTIKTIITPSDTTALSSTVENIAGIVEGFNVGFSVVGLIVEGLIVEGLNVVGFKVGLDELLIGPQLFAT